MISGECWRLETLIIREADDFAENRDGIRDTDGAIFIDIQDALWSDAGEGCKIVVQPNDMPER